MNILNVTGAGETEVFSGGFMGAIAGSGASAIAGLAFGSFASPAGAAIGFLAGVGFGLAMMPGSPGVSGSGRYRIEELNLDR